MKRVWLRTIDAVRSGAVSIARWMTNDDHRDVGDPVHTYVTEGRMKQWVDARARGDAWAQRMIYSSCGDASNTLFAMLGCRDEALVNRTEDGGEHDWISGVNISHLTRSKVLRHPGDGMPQPGDVLFQMNVHGGHVSIMDHIVENADGTMRAITHNYGQGNKTDAKKKDEPLVVQVDSIGHTTMAISGHPIVYWADLSLITFEESALVPDAFEGGEPDENPYAEGMFPIPEGVG